MEYIQQISWALELQFETKQLFKKQSGSKFDTRKPTTFKKEHSNLNSVNPNLSLHSAKRRHDMDESDSNYGQTKRFLAMYLRILPIIFKLV